MLVYWTDAFNFINNVNNNVQDNGSYNWSKGVVKNAKNCSYILKI